MNEQGWDARLPSGARPEAAARRGVLESGMAWGIPQEVCVDAAHVMGELVSNAVRHGVPLTDGGLEVGCRLGPGGLELSVTDGGGPTEPHVMTTPYADGGRGMWMVAAMSSRWWFEQGPSGRTVHAVVDVPAQRSASGTVAAR